MSARAVRTVRSFLLLPRVGSRAEALMLRLRLDWFIRLRWLMVGAALAVIAIERAICPDRRRPLGLFVALLTLAAINVLWTLTSARLMRSRPPGGPSRAEMVAESSVFPFISRVTLFANAQVACDLAFLTAILRYVGGVESPLAAFYLFHMAICSLLLTPLNSLLQAVWAVTLYGGLVFGELTGVIAPHHAFIPTLAGAGLHVHPAYVGLAFAVVGCGIFGTLYFTLQIAATLDEQERELTDANTALRAGERAIRDLERRRAEFMRTAAHQLKTPLAGVQTLTQLLRDDIVPADERTRTHERIIQRCRDGLDQVAELLALARVHDADPARHGESRADAGETLRSLMRRYEPAAEQKGVTLSCDPPPNGEMLVHVDPRDLSDCLGNLIDNALKFTPRGGVVSVRAAAAQDEVSITVADTGPGIDADTLPHIFEPYRRGNAALAAGISGTGLGLTIVRAVVEQAGGRVAVDTRPGAGTTFLVTLPAVST